MNQVVSCSNHRTFYEYNPKRWANPMMRSRKILLMCVHPDGMDHKGDCYVLMPGGRGLVIE
jgi:hypothetical protein